jgi:hypothetical protein
MNKLFTSKICVNKKIDLNKIYNILKTIKKIFYCLQTKNQQTMNLLKDTKRIKIWNKIFLRIVLHKQLHYNQRIDLIIYSLMKIFKFFKRLS